MDSERLLRLVRAGDGEARGALARALARGGEPWGVALAVREDLYAQAGAALAGLASGGGWCLAAPPDSELLAAAPGRADVLGGLLAAVAQLSDMPTRVDPATVPWSGVALAGAATLAGRAQPLLARARRAPSRRKEAKLLAELAGCVAALDELGASLEGNLAGVVRRLDPRDWIDMVSFSVRLDTLSRAWWYDDPPQNDEALQYQAGLASCIDAVLRQTGVLRVVRDDGLGGFVAFVIEARLLRRGCLRALLAAHPGMGDSIRAGARDSWPSLLDWLALDEAVALDTLRHALELWRSEEGLVGV